ncbi:CidA/LrgA family protein [Roseomonas sp. HF4]|uniref:CidA/LrgA family protein n=1 Tax=Roseomonas sp. HF4 TaxID=2562313 RepID=UPI0010C09A71|nr:CidA/LrgA family protein [Roseomonas sp. HF4]
MICGLAALLLCQLAGEALARALALPVPGPVIGMALLFAALLAHRRPGPPEDVARVADGLLAHLGLLFVPACRGVVLHLPLLARDRAPLSLTILVGTLAAIGATGLLAQALLLPLLWRVFGGT